MEPYWELVKRIIIESDLVLEVLDARLVEHSRNEKVEELINEIGRPLIFVVNKSDLISKKSLISQINELKNYGEAVFVSAKKPKDIKILLYKIRKVFRIFGKREKANEDKNYRIAKGDIVVGVLGYPNVGKSSIINALSHRKKTKVSKKAGTTHGIHWIKATKDIKLIDSPGVIPLEREDEIRYGLIGARDSERLKNPQIVVYALVKLFLKNNIEKFENFYGIVIRTENIEEIINDIALKKRYFIKGGNIDENKVCLMIIRDWQQGKLRL